MMAFACLWGTLLGARPLRAQTRPQVEIVAHDSPTRLCPGEEREVELTLRNTGERAWDPAERTRVSYHWAAPDGSMLVRDGLRTELPRRVESGQTIALRARLRAPDEPGAHRLQWAVVREQVGWSRPEEDVPVEIVGRGPVLAWSIAEPPDSWEVAAKGRATLPVHIANRGCATWDPDHGDVLSYRWRGADGSTVVGDGRRTALGPLAPGDDARIELEVLGPPEPGVHRLEIEPLREHVAWFGAPVEGRRTLKVDVGPPALAWSCSAVSIPETLHADQAVTATVTLKNEGTEAWTSAQRDRLSYRWLDASGNEHEGVRSPFETRVEPGDQVEVEARLVAPSRPGSYRLVWEPVREGVTWFGAPVQGRREFEVEVREPWLAWRLEAIDAPRWMWAHRTDELRVTLVNEGADTWSPETSDRLSYRWLDEQGRPWTDEGRRTELPHAVAPGQRVVVEMVVEGPSTPGRYTLELRMVREHVSWFPTPSGLDSELSVPVRRLGVGLVVALVALGLVWVVMAPRWGATPWIGWAAWPGWVVVALGLVAELFADLSGVEFWHEARTHAWSVAAALGLAVAAVARRWQGPVAFAVVTLASLLALADLAYVDFFGSLVPLSALAAMHHLTDAHGTVGALMHAEFGWLLVIPATAALVAAGAWRARGTGARARSDGRRIVVAGALAIAAVPAVASLTKAALGPLAVRVFSEVDNAGRFGVVGAHVFQALRAMRNWGGPPALTEEQRREIAALTERDQASNRPHFGLARGNNLVLLQVEALQSWVVDASVDGQQVMPFLHQAKLRGAYFPRVFDQTAQGRTSDAEYLVTSSGHPLAQGALAFLRSDNRFWTLAHVLEEQGYATMSAHPYARGFWNRAVMHPAYGFSSSHFRRELGDGPMVGWGLADAPFLVRLVERFESLSEPFFAFGITLSLHHPYDDFPDALKRLELGALEGTPEGNYVHAMHHFDRALAGFFDELERTGLRERTVVAIYGDHVTGMDPSEAILKLAGYTDWTPSLDARMHTVPVVVWTPEGELVVQDDSVAGQIDVGPTLLELLGVEVPTSMFGRSLVSDRPRIVALADGSAVTDDRIFVARGPGIGREGGCFDFPSGRSRPLEDCAEIAQEGARELRASRAVLDHDLHRVLAERP